MNDYTTSAEHVDDDRPDNVGRVVFNTVQPRGFPNHYKSVTHEIEVDNDLKTDRVFDEVQKLLKRIKEIDAKSIATVSYVESPGTKTIQIIIVYQDTD